jgi:pimeloyl-ACP methyl ester carboxylesterase
LLHGGACDGRVWARQLEDLSAEFSVVAWDAPGCGGSSDPPETFRMADYADCLADFIKTLGLRRPYVLGHSLGGGLALELYGRHPRIPQALILAGAYAGWAGSLPHGEVERRLQIALETARRGPGRIGSGPGSVLPTDSVRPVPSTEPEAIMSELHPAGTRVMAAAFADADLRYVLPLIDVPTLLVHGETDERAPLEVAEDLHAGIRGSELVVLPGVGHESYQEAPGLFSVEVRRFLRSIQG